jgi:transcriptional regulator with XRE-family HTH domain
MKKKNKNYDMTDIQKFSGNLQKAVAATGLTPYSLAKKIGVSKDTVRNIMKGDRDPQLSTVINIVKGMQLSMDKLLGLVENIPAPFYPVPSVGFQKENTNFIEKIRKMNEQDVELLEAIARILVERKNRAAVKLFHAIRGTELPGSNKNDGLIVKTEEIEKPETPKSPSVPNGADVDDPDEDDKFYEYDSFDDNDDFEDDDFEDDDFEDDDFDNDLDDDFDEDDNDDDFDFEDNN